MCLDDNGGFMYDLAQKESKDHQEQYYMDIWVSKDHNQEVNEGTGGCRWGNVIVAELQMHEMHKSWKGTGKTPDSTDRVPKLGCQ